MWSAPSGRKPSRSYTGRPRAVAWSEPVVQPRSRASPSDAGTLVLVGEAPQVALELCGVRVHDAVDVERAGQAGTTDARTPSSSTTRPPSDERAKAANSPAVFDSIRGSARPESSAEATT